MVELRRAGYKAPEPEAEIKDVLPEIKQKLADIAQNVQDQADAKAAEIENNAQTAEGIAKDLREAPSPEKSPEEIQRFINALKAAFREGLTIPGQSLEEQTQHIVNLANVFTVTTNLDEHTPGTPVQFQGQGNNPASYNVTKDTITVANENFGPKQAKEMVALAALDKSMLEDGVDLEGNEYECSLLDLAIKEYNKENPRAKLKVKSGKPNAGTIFKLDKTAKQHWKAYNKNGSEPANKIGPTENPPGADAEKKDLGVLSEEVYSGLVEHVQEEGKATNQIIKDFLGSAEIGDTSIKMALADAKTALKTEAFIEVVKHGEGERLTVNLSGDFDGAASGEEATAAKPAAKPAPQNHPSPDGS